jgi:WD40 repeat protein
MAIVVTRKKTKSKFFLALLLLFIILICVLSYYQLFYRSPRVDNGFVSLDKILHHEDQVNSIRFGPSDSLVITAGVDSVMKIWERLTGKMIKEYKQPAGVAYMDLSNDGMFAITGNYDAKTRLIQLSDGKLIREFAGHDGTVWHVAFSPDGKKIASAGNDGLVNVWDVETGKLLDQLKGHKRIVWSVKFSPDGQTIASASFDFTFKLWNVADGKLLWDNHEHTETVVDLAFSHNGTMLATTSDDKTIKIWRLSDKSLLRTMKAPEHVQAVAFSPDDKLLMTGGRDKPMIGELLQNFLGDSHYNKGVSARLWEVSTGDLLHTFTTHANDVMDVAYSHDGKWVATASSDKTAEIWKINKQ